ncbi:MAG TPA: hypothetical protein GXX23_04245 [Firmicutes bacterium]|nr:hypothetical protein [Candidatus Fermentithermobacillaceae bacterium]
MPKNEDYKLADLESGQASTSRFEDELRRSFTPPAAGTPTTPAERIEEALCQVQNQIREQQMCTEQDLQECLSKASSRVADSQSVDTMFALVQQVTSMVSQGNEALQSNLRQVRELIARLSANLAQQQAIADRQIARSLHQAVSAMAEAQNAMFQSMAISEMSLLVKGAQDVAEQVVPPDEVQ